jgi:hypothetical protein
MHANGKRSISFLKYFFVLIRKVKKVKQENLVINLKIYQIVKNKIIHNRVFNNNFNKLYRNTFQYIYFVTTYFNINESDGRFVSILNQ